MVTFNDRPGGYTWGHGRPWIYRNNKYSLMTRHQYPFVTLFVVFGKSVAIGISQFVNQLPYWKHRCELRKRNFDLAVDMTSAPYHILKKYSPF